MQKRPEKPSSMDHSDKENAVKDQGKEDGPEIDSDLQAHIGRHLKASYEDILDQAVPDRFIELLSKLEAKEKGSAGPKGGAQ